MTARTIVRSLLHHLPGHQQLREVAFRTGAIRWWWRYRHLIDGSYTATPVDGGAVDPHRSQLWALIAPMAVDSLIEVGCGDGANLALFARLAPRLRLSAVDLNPLALHIAEERVRDAGGTAGEFHHSSAEQLPVPSASADVALSDAVFMYLPPANAVAALREMRRVARSALIVHTFADDTRAQSAVINGNWVHTLAKLVSVACPGASIARQASSIAAGQWAEFGSIYLVTW